MRNQKAGDHSSNETGGFLGVYCMGNAWERSSRDFYTKENNKYIGSSQQDGYEPEKGANVPN